MNGKDEIAAEFKYPSRWPLILVLVIIGCGIGMRWYYKGARVDVAAEPHHRWVYNFFHSKQHVEQPLPVNAVTPIETVKFAEVPKPAEAAKLAVISRPVPSAVPPSVPQAVPAVPVTVQPASNTAVAISAATGTVVATANAVASIQEAISLEDSKSLLQARKKYLELLKTAMDQKQRGDVERRLTAIDYELVLTPTAMPEKQGYVVQSGDSLDKIARKFGTTVELIQKGNLLSSHVIRAGDRFIVMSGKFAIKINKTQNDMLVTLNGDFFARHAVATGKFGKTPVGSFVINDKIKEPVWWRPDGKEIPFGNPENILGTRWMSIKAADKDTPDVKGYGIHGTWDDNSLGKAESAGCIRMKNGEVERLFAMVPVGTVVTITE